MHIPSVTDVSKNKNKLTYRALSADEKFTYNQHFFTQCECYAI